MFIKTTVKYKMTGVGPGRWL